MEQLLAHLVGDYLLQSKWMAIKKVEAWWPAFVHGVFYSLPFLLITTNIYALAVICLTHVVIDRYRLAKIVMWLRDFIGPNKGSLSLGEFRKATELPGVTAWMFFWLMVIVDNTMHLTINFFALKYLA